MTAVPTSVVAENGTKAKIYPPDVPGFAEMSDKERGEVVQKIANKVGKGKDLFTQVQNNPKFLKNWAPTQEDVSDMMWFIKTRAEESIGHPIPDGFEPIVEAPSTEWRAYGHGWRVLPHDHDTDGMTLIRYRREP